jgi:hypothetical protein
MPVSRDLGSCFIDRATKCAFLCELHIAHSPFASFFIFLRTADGIWGRFPPLRGQGSFSKFLDLLMQRPRDGPKPWQVNTERSSPFCVVELSSDEIEARLD